MATEEIQISQLELAQEVQGDMVFAVDTATDTKSLSVNQLKNHISQPLQANINAVDTSALHKYNISNCITEIPQDIKLELNNGTLTLKAGSKVYVPNGAGVFDVKNITSDLTTTYTDSGNNKLFVYVKKYGDALTMSSYDRTSSGTTDNLSGVTYHNWYDTNNNVIHRYNDDTSTPVYDCSFPICIISTSNGAISSIDQVFNGFGYIGDVIFTLPNVKLLISNRFNNDSTLNNIIATNNIVRVNTWGDGSGNNSFYLYADSDFNLNRSFTGNYFEQDEAPTPQNNLTWWRSNKYNITQKATSGVFGGNWIKVLEYTRANNRITSLTPKTAFHAVDYNDFEKAMLKEDWVRVSTPPASPDSSKFYYIPEN